MATILHSAKRDLSVGDSTPRSDRWLAAGLLGLAAGLALSALLGPLATGIIRYPISVTFENQAIGLEAVSLLIVAPLAALAGMLVMRGRVAGAVLALGIGSYATYMATQYVVGPEYALRAGNSERAFGLLLALFVLGWLVALRAWITVDGKTLPGSVRRDRLIGRFVLPALAAFAFARYLPALADAASDSPSDPGYLAGPTFFWVIALLDLGVFLPATIAACVGLVRGLPWARKLMYLVVGWFGLVGPAVAAMGIAMYLRDDPNASLAGTAMMTGLGVAFAALAVVLFAPLVHIRDT